MAEFLLKYADPQGAVHERVEQADSENALRERYASKGVLIYSIKARRKIAEAKASGAGGSRGKVNLEQFLIFNQQFVTLIRAGLPILKSLELLKTNIKDKTLQACIVSIHDAVKNGTPLSDAFRAEKVFPPIYVTSLMAGEKSGSLPEVIERYVHYQKITLSVRKKVLVSLIYPAVLVVLVTVLIVFLVTYVVPQFADLYESMNATLPLPTQILVAVGVALSENLAMVAGAFAPSGCCSSGTPAPTRPEPAGYGAGQNAAVRPIWMKYQVSQPCRLLVRCCRAASADAGAGDDGRLAGIAAHARSGGAGSDARQGRAGAVQEPGRVGDLPAAGDRDDPCGRVDRSVAGDADVGGGVL